MPPRVSVIIGLFLCLHTNVGCAQWLGGRYSFAYLRLPTHAPLAALGSVNVTMTDGNPNAFISNPALLTDDTHRHVSVNYVPYYADVRHASLAYTHDFAKLGRWGAGLHYVDYGTFEETDVTGAVIGQFVARDYAASVAHARTIGNYTLGATLQLAGSTIAAYRAMALLIDIGARFTHPVHDLTIGLTVQNIGAVLQRYTPQTPFTLPLDAQIGVTFKPKRMPLRFSLTAHHLHQLDITYDDPIANTVTNPDGSTSVKQASLVDKIARHFVVGTEILLGKNFLLQAGYNHLVHQEMRLDQRSAGAGFSFGAQVRTKLLELAYARSYHHAAGGINYITLIGDMGAVLKKRNSASDK